ncbi:30S ribosomal protein S19 [candidate division NPL-UPA2 bacterium Unc8]|uniref:Small ribosomal subunit protein uS19 n=1 Tax=candidate division NPL-UPA2 bacterium Unc8 TaxID=1980939 RepID=A0A399FVX7_UNCN2|nr:30S ribosomal protein S19 [Bacillota bacterium]MBT9147246.1 30S ribosomal protein S19 [Bacillota bacterium]RII00301.1 MAG: 30S ribosomal protein S19 [candidate division NPL-UPA2 bacterium Unc8]
MGRSVKKGPYVEAVLLKKIQKAKATGEKKAIMTWARRTMISPEFVGFTFAVHNGKKFIPVYVTEEMVGHKLGEFAPTRIFKSHGAHTDRKSAAKT